MNISLLLKMIPGLPKIDKETERMIQSFISGSDAEKKETIHSLVKKGHSGLIDYFKGLSPEFESDFHLMVFESNGELYVSSLYIISSNENSAEIKTGKTVPLKNLLDIISFGK